MLIHQYDEDDENSYDSSRKIIHLKSIKQMFNQQSILSQNIQYSLKIKGMVLRGLFCKKIQQDKRHLNALFLKWYANSCRSRQQGVIDKFLTSGKISKEKVFYSLKIFAKNKNKMEVNKSKNGNDKQNMEDLGKSCNSNNSKKNNQKSLVSRRNNHNRQKAMAQMNNLLKENQPSNLIQQQHKQKNIKKEIIKQNQNQKQNQRQIKSIQFENQEKQKINHQGNKKSHHHSPDFQSSINHILLQSESILSCTSAEYRCTEQPNPCPKFSQESVYSIKKQQNKQTPITDTINKNQKNRGSISCIDLASGNIRIQLVTCTNLFEGSITPQHSIVSKMTSIVEIVRIYQKLETKKKNFVFRLLLQNYLQDDYQEELLKAKRNLQLVEHNFMIQCEMEAMAQNYQQQNEHLDSIDKNLDILKQKFTLSRTSSIVRALKKIIHPILRQPFIQILGSRSRHGSQNLPNFYQVQQINLSSTSLSNRAISIARIRAVDYNHEPRISRQLNTSKQSRRSGSRRYSSTKDIGQIHSFLQDNLDRCKQDSDSY